MILFLLSRDELRQLLRSLGHEVTGARTDPGQAWHVRPAAGNADVADVQGGTTAGASTPGPSPSRPALC